MAIAILFSSHNNGNTIYYFEFKNMDCIKIIQE